MITTDRKIYSTGYANKDINDLKPLLETLEAVLVDIRFTPISEVMHWRQPYLKLLLGNRYLHSVNLGERRFRDDAAVGIQNLKLGVETLLRLGKNAIIFCACEKQEDCHRRIIADELKKYYIEVAEISNWKSAAFS